MQSNLTINIDRLKTLKEIQVIEKLNIQDLAISNEKDLIFKDPIEIQALVYIANDLIINFNIEFSILMPCKICQKLIEKKVEIKNLYITKEIKTIRKNFCLKEEIRNVSFLQIPSFVECLNKCPERVKLKKYLKNQNLNLPFSDL